MLDKAFRPHLAQYPGLGDLGAGGGEEHQGRQAEDVVLLHNGLTVRVDLGDIHPVEVKALHFGKYRLIAEGGFFQHLAGYAPLGKEIHQHRFASLAGSGQGLFQ